MLASKPRGPGFDSQKQYKEGQMCWSALVIAMLDKGICLGLMVSQPKLLGGLVANNRPHLKTVWTTPELRKSIRLEDADQPHEGTEQEVDDTAAGKAFTSQIRPESVKLLLAPSLPALNSQWKRLLLAAELQLSLCNKEVLPRMPGNCRKNGLSTFGKSSSGPAAAFLLEAKLLLETLQFIPLLRIMVQEMEKEKDSEHLVGCWDR
uniref:RIKEN cDNA 9630041A04 gene n=1 Tax=Mus spicilegus TaxID=10103 RepID=A0A8C6H457_MUSSI